MLTNIETKVRALVQDVLKKDSECFTYANSSVFTLAEANIATITQVVQHYAVLPSGVTEYDRILGSGEYSWDAETGQLTVTADLSSGDIVTVSYTYYKYSLAEIDSYISAALVWISVYGDSDVTWDLTDLDASAFDSRSENFVALMAAIIVKPEYDSYRTSSMSVTYPRTMDKDEKLQKTVRSYNMGLGIFDVITFDELDVWESYFA